MDGWMENQKQSGAFQCCPAEGNIDLIILIQGTIISYAKDLFSFLKWKHIVGTKLYTVNCPIRALKAGSWVGLSISRRG